MSVDQKDIDFIRNSLRMLPPWDNREWWDEFSRIAGQSHDYLDEKLSMLRHEWPDGLGYVAYRAPYVLIFFDNPDVYDHLDRVAPTWNTRRVGGRIGRRWCEQICAAAWRLVVASEPGNPYSHKFKVDDDS